jgi:hypothetical protein
MDEPSTNIPSTSYKTALNTNIIKYFMMNMQKFYKVHEKYTNNGSDDRTKF